MSTGSVPAGDLAEEPVLFAPDVDLPGVSDAELVEDMWAAQERQRREYARDLETIAQLARRRRGPELGTVDGRGGPGADARTLVDHVLAGVREDFPSELALLRGCSEAEAGMLLREALLLTGPLSPTWSYLFAGVIGVRHVKAVVDLLGDAGLDVAAEVQARVLPRAAGSTAPEFRDRLRYHLYRVDAEAKERRRQGALRRIGVFVRRFDEGVSELVVQGPTPAVHASYDMVDALARMRRADGDPRPLGVLRAETALDLVLRPWDAGRPPVTAHLVVHASARSLRPEGDPGRSEDPGEVDGVVVSAAECRDLLRELDMIGVGTPPAGGSILVAIDDPVTGETVAVATRAELRRAGGSARKRRRRRRSGPGSLAGRLPAGPGLTAPPDTDAYEPTVRQKRFLTVRDRRCRLPGCRRRPGRARCDLDHVQAHADRGPTACWNLCCLCQRHHRIKTFAPGWSFRLVGSTLFVRTPAGVTRQTTPPGWYPEPEPDPPWIDEQAPPDPLLC